MNTVVWCNYLNMEIKHIELSGRGAFIIRSDGKRVAEMTYVDSGDTGFTINHTEVNESLRGQNIGEQLLAEAVKYARGKGLKIGATCSFALEKLQENSEYADVFGG